MKLGHSCTKRFNGRLMGFDGGVISIDFRAKGYGRARILVVGGGARNKYHHQ